MYYSKKQKEIVMRHFNEKILQLPFWNSILLELAEGIQYLHNLSLVHRDLKTDNIVFYKIASNKIQPVIIDFGKCQYIDDGMFYNLTQHEQVKYSKRYTHIAPDLISGKTKPTPSTDVYSYGRIMKHIMCYGGIDIKKWSRKLLDICKQCLQPNSTSRPSFLKLSTCITYKCAITHIYHSFNHIAGTSAYICANDQCRAYPEIKWRVGKFIKHSKSTS